MSAPGYQLPRDPTAVMGPRIGAWLVDAVLLVALALVFSPFGFQGEYHDVPEGTGVDACEILRDNDEAFSCITWGDKVYFSDASASWIQTGVLLAYGLLVLVLWQGVSGATPGKLLFGLRTVGEDGRQPGIGRAFIRSVLWIVDGIPFCIPALVGFIAALSSTGHRRVGDMAAKTYVVRKGDAGRPVVVPGMAPGYAQQPYGYGTPTTYPTPGAYPGTPGASPWGAAPPPGAPPSSPWAAPEPGTPGGPPVAPDVDRRPAPPVATVGERPAPPVAPATPTPPPRPDPQPEPQVESEAPSAATTPEPEEKAEDVTPAVDAADPSAVDAGEPETAEDKADEKAEEPPPDVQAEVVSVPEAEAPAAAPPIDVGPSAPPPEATRPEYNPQWDAARGTYIQWDANRSRWLQWDDTAKEWKPL